MNGEGSGGVGFVESHDHAWRKIHAAVPGVEAGYRCDLCQEEYSLEWRIAGR